MGREAPCSIAAPSSRLQGSKAPSLAGQSGAASRAANGSRKHRAAQPAELAASRARSAVIRWAGSQGSSRMMAPCGARPSAAPPGSAKPDGPPSLAAASCAMIAGAARRAASGAGVARAAAMGSGASACTNAVRGVRWPRRMLPQGPGVKRIRRGAPFGVPSLTGSARKGGAVPPCQPVTSYSGQKAGRYGACVKSLAGKPRINAPPPELGIS